MSTETENLRLRRLAVEVEELRRDDAEFARLQREAGELSTRLQQIARAEEARAATQVLDKSKLDQAPRAKFRARPFYPEALRNVGVSGEVVVDFIVDANGDVQKAYARQSSQREFEAVALEAVNQWKFEAGRKGGREVSTHMQVPIVFTVLGGAPAAPLEQKVDEKTPAGGVVRLSTFDVHVYLDPKEGEKKPTGGN